MESSRMAGTSPTMVVGGIGLETRIQKENRVTEETEGHNKYSDSLGGLQFLLAARALSKDSHAPRHHSFLIILHRRHRPAMLYVYELLYMAIHVYLSVIKVYTNQIWYTVY
jgi:hypothetical protein